MSISRRVFIKHIASFSCIALTLAATSLSKLKKKNHSTIGKQTTTKKEGKVNNKDHTWRKRKTERATSH